MGPWRALVALLLLGLSVEARAQCIVPPPTVTLPDVCAGDSTAGSASFCFTAPFAGCAGTGLVLSVVSPDAPFVVTAMHVDGPLGSRVVGDGDFPLLLLPGDSLAADVAAVLAASGTAQSHIGWVLPTGECDVDLVAATPVCAAPDPTNPCMGQACVAGVCVPGPASGPCDDGDPCTVGDTCVAGVC